VSIFGVRTLLFETILLHGSFIDKISPPDRYAGSPLIAVVSSTTIDRARPAVPCFSDINRNRYRRLTHKLCHETWLVIKKNGVIQKLWHARQLSTSRPIYYQRNMPLVMAAADSDMNYTSLKGIYWHICQPNLYGYRDRCVVWVIYTRNPLFLARVNIF